MRPRRNHAAQGEDAQREAQSPESVAAPSVLVLARPMAQWRSRVRRMKSMGINVTLASTPERAESLLASRRFDAALVSPLASITVTKEAVRALSRRGVPFAACAPTRDFEFAVLTMRHGSTDYICTDDSADSVAQRVIDFLASSRLRAGSPGQEPDAYTQLSRHITTLCRDLTNAYADLSDQVVRIAVVSEYDSAVGGDLDLESTLRATLEFLLPRTGPSNASIMLPSSSRDYTLAAYVNHDVEKQSIDCLLDSVANSAAPKIEALSGPKILDHPEEIEATFGFAVHWLGDRQALVAPCRHEGECLAAIALFRTRARPFTEEHVRTLALVAERFARQLHKLVRIKHRHLPKHDWRALGDDDRGRDSAA